MVTVSPQGTLGEPDFDVVVCGGTLGLMLAATLQRRGHRVGRHAHTHTHTHLHTHTGARVRARARVHMHTQAQSQTEA